MPGIDYAFIDSVLEQHGYDRTRIIAIMQDIQKQYRYLPREVIVYIGEKLHMTPAKLYGVATFYKNFSLDPKGKYVIKVCDGTACHVRKSLPILDRLREELGLSAGKITTDDLNFTVQTVACLGACGLAPAVTVNDKVYPAMTPDKASELLKTLKETL